MDKYLENKLLKQAEAIANLGIWELDLINNELFWSDGIFKILNFEPQEFEVSVEIALSYIHPDDQALAVEQMQNTIATGKPYEIRERFITKDKTIKYINSKGNLIKDDAGKPIKLYGVFQDITAIHLLENSYKIINSDLKALIENTPDIIYSIDLDFNLLTFNSSFENTIKQLGLGEVTIGKNVFELFTDEKRELYSAVILIVKNGDRYNFEDVLLVNGEFVTYDISANPIKNEANETVGISIFCKNVSKKKQIEKELERIKINQDVLINSTDDLSWSIDTQMNLIAANAAFIGLIFNQTGKLIKEGETVLIPQFSRTVNNKWKAYYKKGLGGLLFTENSKIESNGTSIHTMIKFTPLYNSNNVIYGLACNSINIVDIELKLEIVQRKEAELEKIMDSSVDIICTLDELSRFIKVNAAAEKIWGYPLDELIGKSSMDLVYQEDYDKTITNTKNLIAGNSVTSFENRCVCKNGHVISIIWSARWDKEDKIMYCTAKDASEIKLKETELKRANTILENAQRLVQIGNYELNLNTNEVYCSDQIYDIFEIDKRLHPILSPQDFLNLTHPDDLEVLKQYRNEITETGKAYSLLYRIITKKNNLKYVRQVVELVYDEKTKSNWHFGTVRDSTVNILAQKELEYSKEKYRYLFDNNPSAMFIFDFETLKIIDCNQESLELYGYSKEEFLQLNVRDIRPPEDIDLIDFATQSEEIYGRIHNNIWRHLKKNGELMHVRINAHLIDIDNKKNSFVQITDITEKLKVEEAIKTSEKQKELIMNSALDAIVCIDKTECITFWNPQAEKIFGWNAEEVVGENLTQLIVPLVHRNAHIVGMKHYLKTKEGPILNKLLELSAINKAGNEFPIELTIIPIKQGEDEFFCSFIRDITQRKKVEKEILESNKRFKYVTKATFDAIWDWDLSTDIFFWGDNFKTLFGYKNEDLEPNSLSWTNKIHPDDYERIIKSIHQCIHQLDAEDNWKEEYRFLKADGNYAFIQDKGIVIRNDKGDAIRMVGAMQDITKKNEEDLRLKLLESVITNANDAVLITEAEPFDEAGHRIVYVNDAFTKMTGYTAEEVIGKTPKILQGPKSDRNELNRLAEAIKKWEACEITIINYKKNGEEFYINLSLSPIADKNGWFTHWIFIERDVTETVLAQQKLIWSYEERNTILESIDDAFFAVDRNWIVTYWNNQAERTLATAKDLVIGKSLWEVFSDSVGAVTFAKFNESIDKNISINFEDYYKPLDKWYDISAYPSENGLSVYFKDITQRKQIQQQFESVISNIPGITYRCKMDNDYTMLFMSDGVLDITGYPAENFVNNKYKTFASIIHNEDLMTSYSIDQSLKNHEIFEIEYRIICADKSIKWVQDKGKGIYNQDGSLLYIDGVIMDITDRKSNQKELEKAYQEKNDVLESIDDGFFATDKNSLVTYWNQKAEMLLGAKKEEVIGKNLHEMFAKPDSMPFHDHYIKAIKENKTVHFEEYSARSKKWFEVSAFASDKGLSVYFKDTTEKKKSESKLLELNQMLLKQTKELSLSNQELEQFAYIASHDLQEPLRMVTSFLTQIEKKYSDLIDDRGKQYIFFAVDGAKRMRQIILDLLEFSRIGKVTDNLEELDLKEIIEDINSLYRKQIEETKAKIVFNDLPKILSYRTPIKQVLQNLISNALKYHHPQNSTKIDIDVKDEGKFWKFSIKDNGIGIDKEYHQKIFIIFQRLHNKDEYSGTGMGLAICKKIINNLGGEIWIETNENGGSCFYFTLKK